jgi:ribosomal protein L37E
MEKLESFDVRHDGLGSDGSDRYSVRCPRCGSFVRDGYKCSCGFEWSIEIKAVGRKLSEER